MFRTVGIPSIGKKANVSLISLSKGFRTGSLSLRDYVQELEGLFEEREPSIRAFVTHMPERFESLLVEVDRLEARFPEPSSRPLLYGVPFAVKDLFRVEGFPTRAGSRLPPDIFQGLEAKAVTILKSAGAVVLGKTVTTEFAYFPAGPTRNPNNLEHTPGGSSSGSAAAVGAGLCPLALGTQTGGSIVRPASYCGIVGFKPSYGRISLEGVIHLAPSLDHVGFFTVDVPDAILVATVLCERWNQVHEIHRCMLGVPEGPYMEKTSEEGMIHFRHTCKRLSDAGFEIRHIEMLQDIEEIIDSHTLLVAAEVAMVHREWFRNYSESYHEKTAELIRRGQAVKADALARCRTAREQLRNKITKIMACKNVSALITPASVGPAPRGLESTGDPIMNVPWTYAGLPMVSVPSGKSRKALPFGLQMVGSWMADEMVLEVARHVAEFVG